MTWEIGLLLILIVVVMALFAWDRVEADVVALSLVVVLVLTGLVPMDQAFSGFGSDTVMVIMGLLVLNAALQGVGLMEIVGRTLGRLTAGNPTLLLAAIMLAGATMSAFISNTATAAFLLPVVLAVVRRANLSPTPFLLPLAFATILSSSVSLISTSTNLVIDGLMRQHDLERMGMFELAPIGIPIALLGLAYIFFFGRHLLPKRELAAAKEAPNCAWDYLTEIVVGEGSALVGKNLSEAGLEERYQLRVVRVLTKDEDYLAPNPAYQVQAGDVLLVEAKREDLMRVKQTSGIEIKANVKFFDPRIEPGEVRFVEVILMPENAMVGRSLKSSRFNERHALQVLGINRSGESLQRQISEVTLRAGDVLLVEGTTEAIEMLAQDKSFRLLQLHTPVEVPGWKVWITLGWFVGCLTLAAFKVLPIVLAVMVGVAGVFITRCITPRDAYREVEWRAIILIGSMLSLGVAMEHTGTAQYLASYLAGDWVRENPLWLLAGFFILTVILTQPMSNQAAAVLVVPIAIQAAIAAGCDPRPFCMMIAVAASCSFVTPLEPACLMVYGPGRYKFTDFLLVGGPLTVLIFITALLLVPRIWPL